METGGVLRASSAHAARLEPLTLQRTMSMGKYFLAWILGVPAVVLVAVYFFMH